LEKRLKGADQAENGQYLFVCSYGYIDITFFAKKIIAINAVHDDPPPRPTDEYVNATIKKRTAKKYGDGIIMSIVFLESLCRLYILTK